MIFDDDSLEQLGYGRADDFEVAAHFERSYQAALARNRTLRQDDSARSRIARLRVKKECLVCRQSIIANRPNRKQYCGQKCYQKHYRLAHPRSKKPRNPGRSKAENQAIITNRYRTDAEFRERRRAAARKWWRANYRDPERLLRRKEAVQRHQKRKSLDQAPSL